MAKIIKIYNQKVPALRFIGKKYYDKDRVNGTFQKQWSDWFEKGWFSKLESINDKASFDDSDAYIGLMRYKKDEPFEYWIGMFFPENTKVPEGFSYVEFNKSNLGVAWVYGKEHNCKEDQCLESLKQAGFTIIPDDKEAYWFFERYACPRFTKPDEEGNIILDICYFVE